MYKLYVVIGAVNTHSPTDVVCIWAHNQHDACSTARNDGFIPYVVFSKDKALELIYETNYTPVQNAIAVKVTNENRRRKIFTMLFYRGADVERAIDEAMKGETYAY